MNIQKIKWSKEKGQTMIYKTFDRKLKIKQHEDQYKSGVHSCVPEGYVVPASYVTPVELLYLQTR